MIKKYFNNLLNTSSKEHLKEMLRTLALLILLVFVGLQLSHNSEYEQRIAAIEQRQVSISKTVGENAVVGIDLEDFINQQSLQNDSFNGRIHDNYLSIESNQDEIIQLMIEVDGISNEGLMILIDEIWDELERIK